jgi:hypothetical protein
VSTIIIQLSPTFLLTPQAQKKSSQKKTPQRSFAHVRAGEKGAAPSPCRLFKKAGENF